MTANKKISVVGIGGVGCNEVDRLNETDGGEMPYNTEGQEIIKNAQEASDNINKIKVAYLHIDKERLLQAVLNDFSSQATYGRNNDIIRNLIKFILAITDTNKNSLNNLDLVDLETVLKNSDKLFFGTGTSTIKEGAMIAYKRAIDNPFFDYSIENAVNLIAHISGNENMTLNDIKNVLKSIKETISEDAFFLNGYGIGKSDDFIVYIIAGFGREEK